MELYEKLIHLRKQKGLSQLKLAEELGVSRQAISKWEVGTAVPSTENLRSLSKLYGVSLDYLVEDKNIESSVENDIAENEPSSDSISNEDKSEITQDRMRSISGKSVYVKTVSIAVCIWLFVLIVGILGHATLATGLFIIGTAIPLIIFLLCTKAIGYIWRKLHNEKI